MKTKTLIIAIVSMFAISTANANTTKVETATVKAEVMAKVTNEMNYPQLALEGNLEGEVLVEFRVDKNGKIQVTQANAEDQQLKEIVVEKLESIQPPKIGMAVDASYYVKFTFDLR